MVGKEFDIHPDFQSIQARPMPNKRWLLGLMNGILTAINAIKCAKLNTIIIHEKIIGPDGHHIPLLIIRPENLSSPSPALLYYHGGGFVFKHSPRHIDYALRYTREANCCVIFVDYRLSPKHPFPAGFNDCYAALLWAFENAEKLGIDKHRIAVGGDSAGGTMAASAAQKAAHEDNIKLCGQLLIYPATDSDCKWPSGTEFADVPPFKALSLTAVWETYLGHAISEGVPLYASPRHGNLLGLAPAYIETAEFDPLRDEGIDYARALISNGFEVVLNETKRTVHGFDILAPDSEISKKAIEHRNKFLRRIFQ